MSSDGQAKSVISTLYVAVTRCLVSRSTLDRAGQPQPRHPTVGFEDRPGREPRPWTGKEGDQLSDLVGSAKPAEWLARLEPAALVAGSGGRLQ